MKKHSVLVIVLVLLALAGTAGWYFGFRKKEKPVILQTEKPRYDYISKTVTATGTIQPVDTVMVGSQVSGTIKNIYADFNDVVRKGQLIAALDKSLFEASVNQFLANLEVAQSNLSFQENNFARETELFNNKVISKSEFETAQYQYLSARATVKSVQAQLDEALKNLSYTNIYSPINGVVLSRNISVGQTVAASFNTPTLFVIARDITRMQVQAAVDEADIGDVRVGQNVLFTVDAYPNISFRGIVRQIRLKPQVSANVVTYTTIIDAPNKDLKLKPGMTANNFIYTREEPHALLVPARALKFKPAASLSPQYKILPVKKESREGAYKNNVSGATDSAAVSSATVWVKSGDSLMQKEIFTGINDDMHVQVLGGLTVYDELVVSQDNQEAKPAAAAPAARSPFLPAPRRATPAAKKNPSAR